MLGLDPKLVVHHPTVDPKIKPVRQKLHKMHPKVALLVKVVLEKILEEKVIHPIDYLEWISNIFSSSAFTSKATFGCIL